MKISAILLVVVLVGFSCKKETSVSTFDGKWKMTSYYDKNTKSYHSKPDSSEDVFLVIEGYCFKAYYGDSLTLDGYFLLWEDGIYFDYPKRFYAITNDNWSNMFFWTFQSCELQYVNPCIAPTIKRRLLNRIRINTALQMDIILTKIE